MPMLLEHAHQTFGHRHVSQPTTFGNSDVPLPLRTLHAELSFCRSDVTPLQGHDLAQPEPGCSTEEDNHGMHTVECFSRCHQLLELAEVVKLDSTSSSLRLAQVAPSQHDAKRSDFLEAWPYSPVLMQLLEDQVLIATQAQETRDLIRILVDLFKMRGEQSPVLTAADFDITNEKGSVTSLLNSVFNNVHRTLLQKAQRNLEAVRTAVQRPSRKRPARLGHHQRPVAAFVERGPNQWG